jgi:hypothetical protein
MIAFSSFLIFSVAHLATEEGLTAKEIARRDLGAAVKVEFELGANEAFVGEDETQLSIRCGIGAEVREGTGGVQEDGELEALG